MGARSRAGRAERLWAALDHTHAGSVVVGLEGEGKARRAGTDDQDVRAAHGDAATSSQPSRCSIVHFPQPLGCMTATIRLRRCRAKGRPAAPGDNGQLLVGLAGLDGADAVGPHHLVVLVLDDVAVPDVLAGVSNRIRTRVTWPG